MAIIETQYDFDLPAHRIWPYLENFGDIQAWWPNELGVHIERVDLEGSGVGQIRHIYNRGFPTAISERLDAIDPQQHELQLSIVGERPAGLLRYQATGRLVDQPGGGARMSYRGEFETVDGGEQHAREFLSGMYAMMFEGLSIAGRRG